MYGGGHTRLGDFEIFSQGNNKWWLPGFSTEPGGTSPGSTGVFPIGGCMQIRNVQIASVTNWRHFTWTLFGDRMKLEVRNTKDPESTNQPVMEMYLPKVDTLNPGPTIAAFNAHYNVNLTQLPRLYYWFPKLEAFRFFWNAGSNVWLSNLKIETTGNTPVTNKAGLKVDKSIHIFPNPGNEILWVSHSGKEAEVQIIDAFGKEVMRKMLVSGQDKINTQSLAKGIYTLMVLGEEKVSWIRWVKAE